MVSIIMVSYNGQLQLHSITKYSVMFKVNYDAPKNILQGFIKGQLWFIGGTQVTTVL